MKYQLYTTSIRAWDAMLEAIKKAKESICIEMYIFLDDTGQEHDFIGALTEQALKGVEVTIVADAFGSKHLRKETVKKLKEAGVEIIFFSHWLRHIHRKILIVDEKIAFIGGVNIGKHFTTWDDLQLKLGATLSRNLMRSFAYTYAMASGKNERILAYREKRLGQKLQNWLIEHWPIRNIYTLRGHYVENISHAQKCIRMVTPYFTPPRWLISLLDSAVRRGILVEIIIPKKVDWRIMNRVNYKYMHDLHKQGVHFYLSEKMNHSKLLLIDDSHGIIGSQNLDLLSFSLNNELGLFFKNKKLLSDLSDTFEKWKRDSESFVPEHFKKNWIDWLILIAMKILRPIL